MEKESYTLEEKRQIAKKYKSLLANSYSFLSKEEKILIRKAINIAIAAHKGQKRRSGEPYIYHPISVAKIVSEEIGLGAVSIAAALLHDVVEDSSYTLENIREIFGDKIAIIINGLTKISAIKNDNLNISEQAENYKKLFFTLSKDLRVILIKISDRLHNMRTMQFMPSLKQKTIVSETLYIFAPLAHRLNLYAIKSELEDLSLKYLEPASFTKIVKEVEETRKERESYITNFIETIKGNLQKGLIECQIKGRPKSVFSIWKKMNAQKVLFEDVYDILAIRIIYQANKEEEKFIAWKINSIITDQYYSNPKRLRDWISQPKSTGYEAIHTTVMGPEGKWVEVQIRSSRMDQIAEKGIASHYRYKNAFDQEEKGLSIWLNKVREALECNTADTIDFVDSFKLNLYVKEIYVFTHKGDLISLPKRATALDFAYNVHSEIGDSCLGAKVNGKLVSLGYVLQTGDQVEIISSSRQRPRESWLNIATTSKARSKIKSTLKTERKRVSEEGKELIKRKLKQFKLSLTENIVNSLVVFFKVHSAQEVFYKVATGEIGTKEIKEFINSTTKGIYKILKKIQKGPSKLNFSVFKKKNKDQNFLAFGPSEEILHYTLASCCNPISGDLVFGFITINQGIKVHREDCSNAISLHAHYDYRIIQAKWVDSDYTNFKFILHIKGIDRLGIIKDITEVITQNMGLSIKNMSISSDTGIFNGEIALHVKNKEQSKEVLNLLKKIEGIHSVDRLYESPSNPLKPLLSTNDLQNLK